MHMFAYRCKGGSKDLRTQVFRATIESMATDKRSPTGLVSGIGRLVKNRLGEFAKEARQELSEGLAAARQDVEDELADRIEPDGTSKPDGADTGDTER